MDFREKNPVKLSNDLNTSTDQLGTWAEILDFREKPSKTR